MFLEENTSRKADVAYLANNKYNVNSIVMEPVGSVYNLSNVIFQHPVVLYRFDLGAFVPSM
jgi:hypothetical protein